jgi:hypothetical protein
MKVKAELVDDEAAAALGDAPETEFTFLLCPVMTYSILSEQAQMEGCSVGEVLQKALLQYLRAARGMDQPASEMSEPRPEPDMVIRRKKRS